MIEQLFEELAEIPQVEAIALGGSRAGKVYDGSSDYDVYLYCTEGIAEEQRRPILERYCSYMELGNHFWELEDNCTLKWGVDIDLLYRNLDDFGREVASVVEGHQAHNGYTTCMWHNLLTCKILYDKFGRLSALKQRFSVPYPQALKQQIIDRNMKLLHDSIAAYFHQLQKAVDRGDPVSINHRTAAFMEAYFDVIFAVNEQTHPGEKRLAALCQSSCKVLPRDFKENIDTLYESLFTNGDRAVEILKQMVLALKEIL